MPLSDARETGANALIPGAAGGRRASETTQCARQQQRPQRPLPELQQAVDVFVRAQRLRARSATKKPSRVCSEIARPIAMG